MEYVTPKYQKQLEELADTLVTPERFGAVALAEVIQLAPTPELPDSAA